MARQPARKGLLKIFIQFLTSVGQSDGKPPVSDGSSVVVLVHVSFQNVLSETTVHEVEVDVLI